MNASRAMSTLILKFYEAIMSIVIDKITGIWNRNLIVCPRSKCKEFSDTVDDKETMIDMHGREEQVEVKSYGG